MEILRIQNLSFSYPNATQKALNNINLSIKSGSFTVLCGESGCGKTTLLRMIKKELTPVGDKSGTVSINGSDISLIPDKNSPGLVGFVFQNPENQIVTDKVWHEMAFGAENIGIEQDEIRRRVAETASYFGIAGWINSKTDELSGGQKQLLNLASIMVMRPDIILLDEPTAQLDPIASAEFISILKKINMEMGITIIISEHHLEEVFPIADTIIVLEQGDIIIHDAPEKIGPALQNMSGVHNINLALPAAVQIFNQLKINDICPISVNEGKRFLSRHFNNKTAEKYIEKTALSSDENTISLEDVWFRYEKQSPDVIKSADLTVKSGEIFCLLGGNGTGKTTALNVIAGISKAYRGNIKINGKNINSYKGNELYRHNIALLPQNPEIVFIKSTVKEDLEDMLKSLNITDGDELLSDVTDRLGITHLLNRHPYDLSGGEQQKCAMAKILLSQPKILLLDEPTKGLDAYSKQTLSQILKQLKSDNVTIMVVTHDVEFAANTADRCALFFDGSVVGTDTPCRFFGQNNFYTTPASRMSRHLYTGAVTNEQVVYMCGINVKS